MKLTLSTQAVKDRACQLIQSQPLEPVQEVEIRVKKSTRSIEQNKRMWAMLADVSRQLIWYGRKISKEGWKDMFSAALKGQEAVPGIDGNSFVILGEHTSKMTVAEMSDMIELMYAFGAERGIRWSDPTFPQEEVA